MTPLQEDKQLIKKQAKDLNRHFSKEDKERAQRHMKGRSASLAIREMQIKTIMRYQFKPVRMAIINKSQKKQALVKMWRKWNPSTLLMGMQTGAAAVENSMEISSKN